MKSELIRRKVIYLLKQIFKKKVPLFKLESEISLLPPFYYRVFLGVLEKKFLLEEVLNIFLRKHKKKKVKSEFKYHLLLSLYTVLFSENDCNLSIKNAYFYAKKYFSSGNANFTEKLLRESPDILQKLQEAIKEYPFYKRLSLEFSLPEWLSKKFLGRFSYKELRSRLSENLPVWGKLIKGEREDFTSFCQQKKLQVKFISPFTFKIITPTSIFLSVIRNSPFLVILQDLSSQILVAKIKCLREKFPFLKQNFLDACSGIGGKGIGFLPFFEKVYFNEIERKRTGELVRRLNKVGYRNFKLTRIDLSSNILNQKFDFILLDVPCSGTGTIQRRPDLRYTLDSGKLEELTRLQKKILDNSFKMLAKNSIIIYSTCSLLKEENEDQLAYLEAKGLKLLEKGLLWPAESTAIFYGVLQKK